MFGPEDSVYRETSRRRASARVWRGRSADLGQPGDYQFSVGGEMRLEWPDLQTQVRKFQKKNRSGKSQNLMREARMLKVSFSDLRLPGRN